MKGRTIAFRLILAVSVCTTAILFAVLGFDYLHSRASLEREIDRNAHNLTRASVFHVETVLMSVQAATETLARALESAHFDSGEVRHLLRSSLEANPAIFGEAIAFAPALDDDGRERLEAPYFHRRDGHIEFVPVEQAYAYPDKDWFRRPRELRRPVWSEPYFDEGGGNVLMVTLSVPFFEQEDSGEQRFRGVVTADLALDWLTKLVSEIKVLDTGYAVLLSPSGTFITYPDADFILNESLFTLREDLGSGEQLSRLGQRLISGVEGSVNHTDLFGEPARLHFAPIEPAGWTLVLVLPEEEIYDDVRNLALTTLSIGVAGTLMMLLVVVLISRSITRPLGALVLATREIAAGHFDAPLPTCITDDEVGELTQAFGTMMRELSDHVRQLTLTTAVKERIESELKIAHDIQMSILPKMFPPLPDRDEIDLYALVEPAKEVGGDFYDFFQIDEEHFCLVIADVSGKGVPASLFMAVTKTLIKATAKSGRSSAEVMTRVNAELAQDNEQSMFVTVFCAILDLSSGEVIYTNAGHNPPFLIRADGAVELLVSGSSQLVLGVMEDVVYRTESLTLSKGERLFLYTDGVTEAMNPANQAFGEARVVQELERLRELNLRETTQAMVASVQDFAGSEPQSDDITIMLVEYQGLSD